MPADTIIHGTVTQKDVGSGPGHQGRGGQLSRGSHPPARVALPEPLSLQRGSLLLRYGVAGEASCLYQLHPDPGGSERARETIDPGIGGWESMHHPPAIADGILGGLSLIPNPRKDTGVSDSHFSRGMTNFPSTDGPAGIPNPAGESCPGPRCKRNGDLLVVPGGGHRYRRSVLSPWWNSRPRYPRETGPIPAFLAARYGREMRGMAHSCAEESRTGKRACQGGGRPAPPFTCEFSSFQRGGGNGAFRFIHRSGGTPACLPPGVPVLGKRGVLGWWDIPSGLDLPTEKRYSEMATGMTSPVSLHGS